MPYTKLVGEIDHLALSTGSLWDILDNVGRLKYVIL
jgi:hypothetical protein